MISQIIRNYRAWRSYDTSLLILSKNIPCQSKLIVSPSNLVKIFGPPSWHDTIQGTTGTYEFEDINLDQFRIFDRYETKENIKPRLLKLAHPPFSIRGKSENALPAIEFWKSNQEIAFWVGHNDYADIKGFLAWAKQKIEKGEDVFQKVVEKYGPIDDFSDYKKQREISRDYGFFKYNKIKWE